MPLPGGIVTFRTLDGAEWNDVELAAGVAVTQFVDGRPFVGHESTALQQGFAQGREYLPRGRHESEIDVLDAPAAIMLE